MYSYCKEKFCLCHSRELKGSLRSLSDDVRPTFVSHFSSNDEVFLHIDIIFLSLQFLWTADTRSSPPLPPPPPTMYTSHASSSILIPLDFIAINISAVYTPPYGDNGSVWVVWMWTTTTCHPLPPPPPFRVTKLIFETQKSFFFFWVITIQNIIYTANQKKHLIIWDLA